VKTKTKGLPQWVITVPLNPNTRRPLVPWPKSKEEEKVAWVVGRQLHDDPGVGIVTGPSNLLVLDLDRKKGKDGLKEIIQYLRDAGYSMEEAVKEVVGHPHLCRTRSGGYHLYYRLPSNPSGKTTTRNPEGIDTRGIGGLLVAPPTPGYVYERDAWGRIPKAPEWLLSWLTDNQPTGIRKAHRTAPGAPVGRPEEGPPKETILTSKSGQQGTAVELLGAFPDAPKVEVFCPVHKDTTASAVVFRPEGRKRIRLHCSGCGRTWILGRLSAAALRRTKTKAQWAEEASIELF